MSLPVISNMIECSTANNNNNNNNNNNHNHNHNNQQQHEQQHQHEQQQQQHEQQRQRETARKLFEQQQFTEGIDLLTSFINQSSTADLHCDRAEGYFQFQKFNRALRDANSALADQPKLERALVVKGKSLLQLLRPLDAYNVFQNINSGSTELNELMTAAMEQMEQNRKALATLYKGFFTLSKADLHIHFSGCGTAPIWETIMKNNNRTLTDQEKQKLIREIVLVLNPDIKTLPLDEPTLDSLEHYLPDDTHRNIVKEYWSTLKSQWQVAGGGVQLDNASLLYGNLNPFWNNIPSRSKFVEKPKEDRFSLFQKNLFLPSEIFLNETATREALFKYVTLAYSRERVTYVEMSCNFPTKENLQVMISAAQNAEKLSSVDLRFLFQTNRDVLKVPSRGIPNEVWTTLENTCTFLTELKWRDKEWNKFMELKANLGPNIFVGFDLAGDETVKYGCRFVSSQFLKELKSLDRSFPLGVLIHFGEITAVKNDEKIRNCIKAGFAALSILAEEKIPYAIGHGIHLLDWVNDSQLLNWCQSETLLSLLRNARRIEVCPFSNWYIIDEAPIVRNKLTAMIEQKLPVVLASDDPLNFTQPSDIGWLFQLPASVANSPDLIPCLPEMSVLTLQYLFAGMGENAIPIECLRAMADRSMKTGFGSPRFLQISTDSQSNSILQDMPSWI